MNGQFKRIAKFPGYAVVGLSLLTVAAKAPAVSTQASASPIVTLDAPGWSLQKICEAISKQIGQKVAAKGDCVTDYLIVHVHNVHWYDLQKKLAWTEYATWSMNGDTLTIQREPSLLNARLAEDQKAVAKAIKAQFAKTLAQVPPPFNADLTAKSLKSKAEKLISDLPGFFPDQANAMMTAVDHVSREQSNAGSTYWLQRIDASLPVETLAALPVEGRIVFSNHPTSLQIQLPQGSLESLSTYVTQQDSLTDALNSLGISDHSPNGVHHVSMGGIGHLSLDDTFDFAVERLSDGSLMVNMRAFDQNGFLIESNEDLLNYAQPDPDDPNSVPPEKVKIDPVTAAFASYLMAPTDLSDPIIKTCLDRLKEPVKNDPLSLVTDPTVSTLAQGKNIVLHDDGITSNLIFFVSAYSYLPIPVSILQDPEIQLGSDMQLSPDWLVMRDNLAQFGEYGNLDRPSYQDLIQSFAGTDLDQFFLNLAKFATANPSSDSVYYSAWRFIAAVAKTGKSGTDGMSRANWKFLRVIGSLEPGELQEALSPSGLNIQSLNSASAKVLLNLIMSKFSGSIPAVKGVAAYLPSNGITIVGEPTYAYANNSPAGVLYLTKSDEESITFTRKAITNEVFVSHMSPEKFGDLISIPSIASEIDMGHLQLGTKTVYTCKLVFNLKGREPMVGSWSFVTNRPQVYSDWHQLPDDVVQKIQKGISDAQKSGQFGAGPP